MRSSRIKFILLLAVGSVVAFWLFRKYRVAPNLDVEKLTVRNLQGEIVDLTKYRGKTLFVNYWATWCPDCRRELPSIQKLADQVDRNKVIFLLISDEPLEKIQSFASNNDYDLLYLQTDKPHQENGIFTLPTTYIFDNEGYEVTSKAGGADWSEPSMVTMIRGLSEK
ncbi:MAG: TlpA family protein disulfide reductase [Bacteroidia bacterium]|nr:TlpA family protein disulfide reductase [Bacteroidia bacterium]